MAANSIKNPFKPSAWKGNYWQLPPIVVATYGALYLVWHLWIGLWHWAYDHTHTLQPSSQDIGIVNLQCERQSISFFDCPQPVATERTFNESISHEIAVSWVRVVLCFTLAALIALLTLMVRRYLRLLRYQREQGRLSRARATLQLAKAQAPQRLYELVSFAPRATKRYRRANPERFELIIIADGSRRSLCLNRQDIRWSPLRIGNDNACFPGATVDEAGTTVYGDQAVIYTSANTYGLSLLG